MQPGASTVAVRVVAVDDGAARSRRDRVAVEEPLEIRAAGPDGVTTRVAVTMRTPGDDFALAAGFLLTEGVVADPAEIAQIRYCSDVEDEAQRYNVVTVHLRRAFDATSLQRNFYATSSCGVCGKAAIEHLEVACPALVDELVVGADVLAGLPDVLRAAQRAFERTGGIHATGLFDAGGELLVAREDVGRHNAMDKAVGTRLLAGHRPAAAIALVSGRASFELVQKAAVAGVPVLAAVGAPSSLAVSTAERVGMTLVGFLRGSRLNVYSHPRRVAVPGRVAAAG